MAQIDKCPSGALSYSRNVPEEMAASTESSRVNIIECLPDGPLLIKGQIIVRKSDGTEEIKTGSVALRRCGGSKNKPYCDGGHRTNGFVG